MQHILYTYLRELSDATETGARLLRVGPVTHVCNQSPPTPLVSRSKETSVVPKVPLPYIVRRRDRDRITAIDTDRSRDTDAGDRTPGGEGRVPLSLAR